MAVLRSGERNTVFVAKDGGSFEPRDVKLGLRTQAGLYEVLSGLTAGERIVTSGQFMLDSESQLREAIQKMLKGNTSSADTTTPPVATGEAGMSSEHSAHAGHDHAADADHASHESMPGMSMDNHASGTHGPLYTCPMEEHADVVTDKPGRCPKCGMKLVPTSESDHGKQSEEIWMKAHAATTQSGSSEIKQSVDLRLPPGHPKIAGMSVGEYIVMTAKQEAAKRESACGSCGMSAEAMAAGEPCEHDKPADTKQTADKANGS
jgi:rubrerythrin